MDRQLSRVITIGTLATSLACVVCCVYTFIIGLPGIFKSGFNISFIVTTFDIILLCLLIALTSLSRNETLQHLFGFLQYKAGTGFSLIFVGSLVLGMAGTVGLIIGSVTMAWGVISIVGHFTVSGSTGAPTHEPLLPASGQ